MTYEYVYVLISGQPSSIRFASDPHERYPTRMRVPTEIILVALGGAVGAVARYWVSGMVYRLTGPGFPWGTLVVNLVGCFLIGVVIVVLESTIQSGAIRAAVAIGFLGAFTTFSTFSYETLALLQDGDWLRAGAYVAGSVMVGLLAVAAGFGAAGLLLFGRG
jgi:CrcB protein